MTPPSNDRSAPGKQTLVCPMCGGAADFYATASDVEYFCSEERFTYGFCRPCDILFIDPMPTDRLAQIYPINYYAYVSSSRPGLVERIKRALDGITFNRVLAELDGDDLALLDVGGGSGWMASRVRALDGRIKRSMIVDLDAGARSAAEAAGHAYFCGPIESLPDTEAFDLILMFNLIEHVEDPLRMLVKARRLLKPGGRLLLKTPNFRSLDAALFRRGDWGGYHCPRHFIIFSRESLTACVGRAGLAVSRFSYTQGAPFWSVAIFERMRRWGWVTASSERPSVSHPFMPWLQALAATFDYLRSPFSRLSQMTLVLRALPGQTP